MVIYDILNRKFLFRFARNLPKYSNLDYCQNLRRISRTTCQNKVIYASAVIYCLCPYLLFKIDETFLTKHEAEITAP